MAEMEWVCYIFVFVFLYSGLEHFYNQYLFSFFKENQGAYGSVGRMGMGNNYSGGYGTPDGLGGYGKSVEYPIQFLFSPLLKFRVWVGSCFLSQTWQAQGLILALRSEITHSRLGEGRPVGCPAQQINALPVVLWLQPLVVGWV